MQRRQLLKSTAAFSAASVLAAPAIAQAPRKITFLTWNLVHLEAHIKGWLQGFTSARPGVEVEWIDKKGPELPVYYQTQLAAGTPPDVIDIQARLGSNMRHREP
jgi:ABC-type glycerol-3-phosphate transport system substrate-binding protein